MVSFFWMRRRLGLCALAVAGLVLGNAQPALGEAADTIPAPKASQTRRVPVTPAAPSAQEQALAQQLAAALAKAGIPVDDQDLNSIVQGITEGGQAAMAVAMFIVSAIAEVSLEPPNTPKQVPAAADPTSGRQTPGDPTGSLSVPQIDGLIARLPPDTTLKLTRYLRYKLTQFRKSKPQQ